MLDFDNIDMDALQRKSLSRIQELILLPEDELIARFNSCCDYDASFAKAARKSLLALGDENIKLSHLATWIVLYEQKEHFGVSPLN